MKLCPLAGHKRDLMARGPLMEEIAAPVRIPISCLFWGIPMCHGGDEERDLRRRALAALHAGILPRVRPLRSWGGDGSGEICPVCGRSIEPAEKELELEFATAEREDAVREFHLHLPCFVAWEFAREFAAKEGVAHHGTA
jgi:hypothetical protein